MLARRLRLVVLELAKRCSMQVRVRSRTISTLMPVAGEASGRDGLHACQKASQSGHAFCDRGFGLAGVAEAERVAA